MHFLLCRLQVLQHIKTSSNLFKHTRAFPIRLISSTASKITLQQDNKSTSEASTWKRIYYFSNIKIAAVLNRLKLYQTTFTIAAIPMSVAMYNFDMIELEAIGIITGCAVFASATLYVMTGYFRRLIGIISITDDNKLVKISHLTFWGRRNDLTVPLEDIVPLSDCDCNANDIYVKVKRYSTSEFLYLTLKYGNILDKSKFELVFGSLDIIGFQK